MANRTEVKVDWQDSSEGEKEEQKVTIADLFVSVGAKVKEGETLALVESEKATVEILSPVTGEIVEVRLKTGEEANYGSVLCVIEEK